MPWLLTFHIAALLCWCGALFYLPGLLVTQTRDAASHKVLPQWVYTSVATPCALAAVILGTLVFAVHGILDTWLIIKLMLVALLVILHLLTGWLVVQVKHERLAVQTIKSASYIMVVLLSLTITAIVWLVLAKPEGL